MGLKQKTFDKLSNAAVCVVANVVHCALKLENIHTDAEQQFSAEQLIAPAGIIRGGSFCLCCLNGSCTERVMLNCLR